MDRHDEAHAACLNILNDNEHSAPRIAELCTFTRKLGGEVDALRAELARVKAESLRVVVDGPVCELQDCITEYCFIEGKNRLNVASQFAKRNYPIMRVQPVRLERWEDE